MKSKSCKVEKNAPCTSPTKKIPFRSEELIDGLCCLGMGNVEAEMPNRSGIKIRLSSALCSKQNAK